MEWPELKDLRDKVMATERELLGIEITNKSVMKKIGDKNYSGEYERTKGQSEWEGWGTALKPANEPICVARKPLSEKSVAENVLKWGTGGINVDGCRVGTDDYIGRKGNDNDLGVGILAQFDGRKTPPQRKAVDKEGHEEGRFPANIILECICDEVIKGDKGEVKKSGFSIGGKSENSVGLNGIKNAPDNYGDKGDIHTNPNCPCRLLDEQSGSGASRFFYNAKVSKKERNMGLKEGEKSTHPTVKPINLMTYLCRLITPKTE